MKTFLGIRELIEDSTGDGEGEMKLENSLEERDSEIEELSSPAESSVRIKETTVEAMVSRALVQRSMLEKNFESMVERYKKK